ncbi:amino acid adenylation domain-containing protein [Actinophytocola sp. KF-1]
MTRPADGFTHVPHALEHWARERRDDTAFTCLGAGGAVERVLTYGDLAAEAARVAAFLRETVRPGERVLLLFPPGADYLAAFLGCLSAGVVAVPLYPPRPGAKLDRITAVVDDCAATLALTAAPLLPLLADLPVPAVATGDLPAAAPVPAAVGDVAFLQYTSGSTGTPKGVVVSHANLVANLRAIEAGFGIGPDDVVLSWLPMYHDMGLIGTTLLPLYAGIPAVLLPTFEFVRDPLIWPLAVARFGATCSGGPDFAYRLLAERYDPARLSGVDLSRWRIAFNGAEPVRAATMAAVAERYGAHGFAASAWFPCYGLAEATLFVTGAAGVGTTEIDGRAVVSSGPPAPDTTVVVVDAAGRPVTGAVGEILVRSPGVARGYWGNPDTSAFRATVPGHAGEFLRTGDLGALVGGALHVAGRAKDLIIVGGRNHHPHDLEAAAAGADARVRGAAAFQVGDGVVLVAELVGAAVRLAAGERAALSSAVRRAVSVDCGLDLAEVVFVRPGAIPKTSSGKTRRAATRELYERGELKAVGQARAAARPTDLRSVLVERIGFDPAPGDAARPLAALGLDSMKLMALKGAAEAATGTRLPAELFFGDASLDDVLAAALAAVAGATPAEAPATVPDVCPATDSQLQMLFHDQLHPDDRSNTLSVALRLDRPFPAAQVHTAVAAVVARHPALRTTIRDGHQHVHDEPRFDWAVDADLAEVSRRPFDLERGPLVRAAVVLDPANTTVLVACHHAIADYVSLRVVLADVVAELLGDRDFALTGGADPRVWTAEQARHLATPEARARLAELADRWRPVRNEVLFAAPPAHRRRNPAAVVDFAIDADRTAELYARSAARGTTPFVTVAAAYLRALHRVTGRTAVTIGTTHHGRTDTRFANTVGYLVNPVPLRGDFTDGDRLADIEDRTRDELRDALRTADLPFAALVRALAPDRHGQNPVFQATLTYQQSADGRLGDGFAIPWSGASGTVRGVGVTVVDVPPADVAFALSLYGARDGDRTVYRLVYQRELVGEAVAQRVVDEFRLAVDEALGRTAAVAAEEVPTLQWAPNLSAAFARSVELFGDRTALRCGTETLTYRELDARVAALAGAIAARADDGERPVGILLDRSLDMVVAALAVVRTGAAYVPVDPATPVARTALILADAAPSLVVTTAALAERAGDAAPVLLVDGPLSGAPLPAEVCQAGHGTRAYVIFTSGTTGRPKGVEVSHGNLLRLFTATEEAYGFGPDDVWTLFHSFAFDFSVWEMWGALLYGGCLVVVPREVATDPAAFRTLLRDNGVTVLNQTPTAFTQLVAEDTRHPDRLPLRYVIFGGEALRLADLRRWVAGYGDTAPRLVNMYGITETTVHASYRPLVRADLERTDSPIGLPLSDLDFVLVDDDLNPVPDGESGEIVVTGPGVALGYLNRPDLTAERFVTVGGVRGYRSGDLAVRTSGEYVYLGRKDDQVKIRGFRIELGEIQAALTGAPGVRQAAVVVDQPPTADVVVKEPASTFRIADTRELIRGTSAPASTGPRIVAYVVGADLDGPAVFAHLHACLPGYMVPAFVVPVAAIPLNHNGKVDRDRLPAPSAAGALRASTADGTAASPAERRMCALFEEVLGTTGVRPDDSFFAIGGDSIIALRLRTAALAQGVAIELSDIYALQTPRAIAAAAGTPPEEAAAPVAPFAQISAEDRALVPAGVVDAYPVSTLQAGFLFHSTYQTDVNMYCDVFLFTFGARYDHAAMRTAVDRAVAKHEMLRTSFDFTRYSEPLQLVHATAHLPLTCTDLRHLDEAAQEAELAAWWEREKQTPYDWNTPPLVRFAVHVTADDVFRFAMSFHDATLDGWSESVMMTGILTEYWALLHDRPLGPVELPARRYADFVAAEREVLARPSAREFWAREMADVVPTPLPSLASGARDIHDGRMGFLSVDLPADVSQRLDELAGALSVSLKHVLVAVHARVQALLSGQSEVVVGIVSNGRVAEEGGTESLGVHINVVPYRLTATGLTWTELANKVLAKDTELLATRGFPYAEIRRLAGAGGDLFDVSFNFTHFHGYERLAAATGIAVLDARAWMQTSFALRVELNKDPFTRLLSLDLEANMERVSEAQLHQIGELYRNALAHVVAAPDAVPANRDLLGDDTYRRLLAASRGPVRPHADTGFLATFAKSVAAHPGRVAAMCGDDAVTYAELAARVASCAGWLAARGVGAGDVVALRAGRDIGYLVALMAVLRVGAVYLPLPAGPASRVASMLRRGAAVLVLHDDASADVVREAAEGIATARLADVEDHAPYDGPLPGGRDGAYVIFTSGSTGEPKGALIRHDGMLNHVLAKVGVLGIAPGDRVSQDAAATFDISLWQWFSPLAVGATTVIYPDEVSQDPPRLLRAVAEDGITVLEVAPSVLSVFCAELAHYGVDAYPPFALRWVASSGETLKPGAANEFRRLLPDVRLLNMWGITETSDDTTHHEVTAEVDERLPSVPVGTPIENTAVYVLDGTGEPVPDGTPGELYVGGVAVGAGYVNDPDRTAAAFVPDPFDPGATLYKTGDRGRVLADGSLEFLGRVDRQLKIRGQRVELGEVEAALAAVPGVGESAVVVRTDDGEQRLAGFFVARTELSTADLRAALAGVLPRYAVPDFLVCLDELPRTPHGKVDTKALQRTEVLPALERVAAEPPATATEAAVLEVIGAVLRTGTQDPTADFFELGGHSLHATHVMARLRDRFGVHLPLRLLFEHRTARGVAAAIDEALGEWRAEEVTAHGIPDRPAGMTRFPLTLNQASLWYLHQVDPDDRAYDNLSLLHLRGPLDVSALRHAVATMARRHEVLTVRFGDQGGVPYQTPAPGAPVELEVVDATGVATDRDAMVAHVRAGDHRFDLARGPLAIARLHRFGPEEHVFEWRVHHIVTDGWSSDVAMREIRAAYLAHLAGRDPGLPELRVQYADYARWQQDYLATHAQQDENFWKSYLDGYDGVLEVATTYPRDPARARTAGYVTRTWDRAAADRIAAFAAGRHVTPFILGHAVTAVLMAKLAQQDDVVVGAVVAGRTVPETEQLVGFFANTLPLRYSVDLTATPASVLSSVAASAVSGMENQLLPFGRIVEAGGVRREPGVPPLVQVLTTFDNFPFDLSGLPGLTSTLIQVPQETSRFDLLFRFVEWNGLELTIQYDATLFSPAAAGQLADGVVRLLDFFVTAPDRPLTDAVLCGDDERAALAAIWRDLTGEAVFDAATVLASEHATAFLDLADRRGLLTALLLTL